ncbi:MAG: hypothetical protein K0Q59_4357 [Paenibacillus sp.]|nr:hypothetical protein [Paenibacillus sp.]
MNAKQKWMIAGVATLVLTTALYTRGLPSLGTSPVYAAEVSEAAASRNVITVTGQGEMMITPDVAYITLGVRTEAATANEAQQANAAAQVKLQEVLHDKYKLADKDVQTSSFRVEPEYTYTEREQKLKGYVAYQMLNVTYRDLDNIGTFLDAASQAGANQIDGIRFSTEKGQEYELQVISKAMDNAKAKAEAISKYAGKPLKEIVTVSQGGGVAVPSQYSNIGYGASAKVAMDSAASTSISAGELKVTTSVTVQYEF